IVLHATEMPRPRFSLATLFIVLTAVGGWLGYSLKWMHDRRAHLRRERVFTATIIQAAGPIAVTKTAPGLLWLFGEEGQIQIVTEHGDAEAGKRLFSEASV